MDEIARQYHDVANIFPLMSGEEFEALKADIAQHGLHEPIWLHPDGSIVDGRNRHRACIETGTPPIFREWDGNGSLVAFVVSMNMHRRHLSQQQKAFVALGIKCELEKEIAAEKVEKNRRAAKTQWRGPSVDETNGSLLKNFDDEPEMGFHNIVKTHDDNRNAEKEAAEIVGVSQGYINNAQRLTDGAPDLADQVRSGEIKMTAAMKELKHRQVAESPPLPTKNKYRVIYADPPWKYSNDTTTEMNDGTPNYGNPEYKYPAMSIDELCEMGKAVKDMAEKDSVLFLWVTSPLLEECFAVIKAWGFKYKTSFVWDKVKHNFGHYNSVRHELLLICVRGSCTPDIKEKIPSVQRIERTEHSVKPEAFREIIDKMYPSGNRIELFARRPADNWEVWGNESGN